MDGLIDYENSRLLVEDANHELRRPQLKFDQGFCRILGLSDMGEINIMLIMIYITSRM